MTAHKDAEKETHVLTVKPHTMNGPAAESLADLLKHYLDTEGKDFMVNPSGGHVYRRLVAINAWMRGETPRFGINLPPVSPDMIEDQRGGCPICGATDGGLGLSDRFWFFCRTHQVRWRALGMLSLLLLDEDPENYEGNFAQIGSFQEVYPLLNPEIRIEGA